MAPNTARELAPEVVLRARIGFEEGRMQQLIDGRMDIGVMYTPQSRPRWRLWLPVNCIVTGGKTSRAWAISYKSLSSQKKSRDKLSREEVAYGKRLTSIE